MNKFKNTLSDMLYIFIAWLLGILTCWIVLSPQQAGEGGKALETSPANDISVPLTKGAVCEAAPFVDEWLSDTNEEVSRIFEIKTMDVSAYCPCEKCCGKFSDEITASGHKIEPGDKFVAAPKEYPFGTKIYIPGYGLAKVEDRGGAIKGDKLDVFYSTHQEALAFGRKKLEVVICR